MASRYQTTFAQPSSRGEDLDSTAPHPIPIPQWTFGHDYPVILTMSHTANLDLSLVGTWLAATLRFKIFKGGLEHSYKT